MIEFLYFEPYVEGGRASNGLRHRKMLLVCDDSRVLLGKYDLTQMGREDATCRDDLLYPTLQTGRSISSDSTPSDSTTAVLGFVVGDKVRLKDGDGRVHTIARFEKVDGLHGRDFYTVIFEDDSATATISADYSAIELIS